MYSVISILIISTLLPPMKSEVINDPTITADPNFSASDAAKAINDELFLLPDDAKIANTILRRTYEERNHLSEVYYDKYYRDSLFQSDSSLLGDLKDETDDDDLCKLYDIAFTPLQGILAAAVHDTIEGASDDCEVIEEVICAQDNKMKSLIQDYYVATYHVKLEEHFKKYKSGDAPYQEAMLKYCWPNREEKSKIDENAAIDEAKALKALLKDKEKFKSKLKEILAKHTEGDLKLIFQKYRDDKRGIDNDVDDVFEGNEKAAYGTLLRYIESTCKYYADTLQRAVQGGPDLRRINRITLTRCERDMLCIANAYRDAHSETFTQTFKNYVNEGPYLESIRYFCGKK